MAALTLVRRRRRISFIPAALLAGFGLLLGTSATGPARAISGGDPYSVPVVVDVNPDPNVVETTIVAEEATVDVGNGVMANALTFNGALPGPEFRLNVGDTVIVHFQNELMHPTGIHWHGIELANASDGTPLTQNQVPPGDEFLYKFIVSRPGVFWYHPHHHASTNQVFQGLYGSIIVADPHEAALQASGVLPPPSQTRTLALSDITVCKAPGSNDTATYDPSLPHASGGPLPVQPGPTPFDLCEGAPIDEEGNPRGPYAAGDVPNIQKPGTSGRVNEGQTVLTNGKNVGARAGSPSAPGALAPGASTLDVLAGQGLRLQIGNTAAIRFFRLRLTDSSGTQIPLVRVGGQGGLLDDAVLDGGLVAGFDFEYDSGEILLGPGDRADVVAAIPSTATGTLTLWTRDFTRSGTPSRFVNIPTVPVAHLNVAGVAGSVYTISGGTALRASVPGAAVEALGPATGTLLDPTTFAPPKPGLPNQDIKLTATGISLGIDSVIGEHDFPGVEYTDIPHFDSTRYAELGDTLELTVTNTTSAHHPFHLHGFSIQPLELVDSDPADADGVKPPYTFPYREFRDNIDVPPLYTLRFRVRLDDRPLLDGTTPGGGVGRWVFHCHIFHHATFGMISEFVVLAPNGNERPYVNADEVAEEVDEGQTATMTGTYDDPDGDAVTLSASIGTVADLGGGTWSWSYTTTDGPDESQLVYVTATDAGGKKDVAAFELVVNNLPPTISITSPAGGSVFFVPANVTVTASVADPGTADVLTCTFDWDGGGPADVSVAAAGSCSASNIFTNAGVFTVLVTVDDGDGGSDSDSVLLVVVDPDAGFVTGGGTIDSPAGALASNPLLSGKANFSVNAKYQKNGTVPKGQSQLSFQVGDFKFHSDAYEWLVVAGGKTQYRGTGTIGGSGSFGFLLTATDGDAAGGDGVDRYRLKVWNPSAGNAVVYDNAMGSPEDIDVANPQAIAAGSIVVHKGS